MSKSASGGDVNGNSKDVANLIVRRLITYFEGNSEAIEDLMGVLQSRGIGAETIRGALEFLLSQTQLEVEELLPAQNSRDPMRRVLSQEERGALTAEAYGYLLGLTADGRLQGDQLEEILARLSEGEDRVDLEEIQELAWQVTLKRNEQESPHGPTRFVH